VGNRDFIFGTGGLKLTKLYTFLASKSSLWYPRICEIFSIDLRSLAVFRIAIATLILVDLLTRAGDLTAHYADDGAWPIEAARRRLPLWGFSLHLFNGSVEFQAVLFLITGAFALAMLVGYHTRLVTPIVWLLMLSLHRRNPQVLQGGDHVLRVLLFWSMFLPLGSRYGVDAHRNRGTRPASSAVRSIGAAAILLQVCIIYWFAGLLKSRNTWYIQGDGVYYALMLDRYVTPIGKWLLDANPILLKLLNYGTLGLELFGPLLALFPIVARGPVRCGIIAAFWLFHLGMGICLELWLFGYICSAAWLLFIPSWVWDHLKIKSPTFDRQGNKTIWARLLNGAVVFLLIYVLFWNLRTANKPLYRFFPGVINPIGYALGLDQAWGVFAGPSKKNGWFVITGQLEDGTRVNLLKPGEDVLWDKPELVISLYESARWRRYMRKYVKLGDPYRMHYGEYLCHRWNESNTGMKQLHSLHVYYMNQRNLANRQVSPPKRELLLSYTCD